MLQLKNQTPFAADFAVFPNNRGIDTLFTVVKATLNIGPKWTLSDTQIPVQHTDVYTGEPGESSIITPSDFHTGKACTDILMLGNAIALDNNPVYRMETAIRVGDIKKRIMVSGDRFWDAGRITSPEPFTQMPLCFERAFGGVAYQGKKIISQDPRNPVGVGYSDKKQKTDLDGTPLPNLEYPNDVICHQGDIIAPACFAPLAPNWEPRATYGGTYDEHWKTTRAPYLPDDYDLRFMNSASADQQYSGFLIGGEPVSIKGMHASGDINLTLPQINLRNRIRKKGDYAPPFVLETLILNPNNLQLSMVWRSALECDKQALNIEEINISLAR